MYIVAREERTRINIAAADKNYNMYIIWKKIKNKSNYLVLIYH